MNCTQYLIKLNPFRSQTLHLLSERNFKLANSSSGEDDKSGDEYVYEMLDIEMDIHSLTPSLGSIIHGVDLSQPLKEESAN